MCAFGASVFFFNDTATTEIYTLSLHDALPISPCRRGARSAQEAQRGAAVGLVRSPSKIHTADCRLRQGETPRTPFSLNPRSVSLGPIHSPLLFSTGGQTRPPAVGMLSEAARARLYIMPIIASSRSSYDVCAE